MSLFSRHSKVDNKTRLHGAKLITLAEPKGPIAEQFRTIQTNIGFMGIDHPIKTLAFTSANISEGKSTVTDNVAIAWAQTDKRVLLIDADLRRPTLYSTFNVSNRQGLTSILTSNENSINVEDFLQASGVDNLDILTSGPIPPNPAQLLNSNRLQAFIDAVERQYDIVILDVPPLLAVSDTQALMRKLDGVVLVVKNGQTEKLAAKRAVELLRLSKTRILGYVMNDVGRDGDAGYGYGYGYGYSEDK